MIDRRLIVYLNIIRNLRVVRSVADVWICILYTYTYVDVLFGEVDRALLLVLAITPVQPSINLG